MRTKIVDGGGIGPPAESQGDQLETATNRVADAAPLLEGLPGNLCQRPDWGTVLSGSIHVRYAGGSEETVRAGDVYDWPPGHTVRVDENHGAVEFSPSGPTCTVIDHLNAKLGT